MPFLVAEIPKLLLSCIVFQSPKLPRKELVRRGSRSRAAGTLLPRRVSRRRSDEGL